MEGSSQWRSWQPSSYKQGSRRVKKRGQSRESKPGSESETGGDDGGEALRDGSDGEGNSNLEVVDGSLDPGTTVGGVVEVANVDCPDSNADKCDHLVKV